jgi:tetratricopeptide (TPR) repeat protein
MRTIFPSTRTISGALVFMTLLTLLAAGPARAQHNDKQHKARHGSHDPLALKADPRLAEGQLAPLLEGLGDHHHSVTTASDRAQVFFDQGLSLTYAFNHQEALRSFKEAARLDPDCAMAYWGWALVLGPNLNLPMAPEVTEQAYKAIQEAVRLSETNSAISSTERDYIAALATRYSARAGADRTALNAAYAKSMAGLARKHPEDPDAATLYAAALMNTTPWDYWTRDGNPKGPTAEILRVLESAIALDPKHEGALHYYVHIIEPVDPDRGERVADALRGLAPGAGHLVHMPSHIYMQTGRYEDAFQDNVLAAKADENYIIQCRAQGIYPLTYYPHNVHFLVWAAWMQGRSAEAIEASRKVAAVVPEDRHDNVWGLYQTFLSMPIYSLVRFGRWDQILQEPTPDDDAIFLKGIWHYARGLAQVHSGSLKLARRELKALSKISGNPRGLEMPIGFTNGASLLGIANHVLSGEILARAGRFDDALAQLDRATRVEESMLYNEPPDWYYPVRHTLGAVLMDAGRPAEAEVVYWQDLRKNRDNGFALFGLWKALLAQERHGEAADVHARFRKAWAHADFELTSSRY